MGDWSIAATICCELKRINRNGRKGRKKNLTAEVAEFRN